MFLQICDEQNLETGRLATIGNLKTVGITQNTDTKQNTATHVDYKGFRFPCSLI